MPRWPRPNPVRAGGQILFQLAREDCPAPSPIASRSAINRKKFSDAALRILTKMFAEDVPGISTMLGERWSSHAQRKPASATPSVTLQLCRANDD